MSPSQRKEQLAEELTDLCADALKKAGFPIQHGGTTWQAIADAIEQNMGIT